MLAADLDGGGVVENQLGTVTAVLATTNDLTPHIDCGSSCPACAAGTICAVDGDCASGSCDNGIASLGTCQ